MASLEEIKAKAWDTVAREKIDYWSAVCLHAEAGNKYECCANCPGMRKYALCDDFESKDSVPEPRDFFTIFSRMLREERK